MKITQRIVFGVCLVLFSSVSLSGYAAPKITVTADGSEASYKFPKKIMATYANIKLVEKVRGLKGNINGNVFNVKAELGTKAGTYRASGRHNDTGIKTTILHIKVEKP